jgi:alkylated DNA repair dioxygenase AlkB
MTDLLDEFRLKCESVAGASFNSVLVNLYRDGNDSVSWHSDNEAINGREPTIASVSLGATRRFDLRHRETKQTVRVDLEGGSLLVMSGLSQICWVHQIAKTKTAVGPRINLTFRLVNRA